MDSNIKLEYFINVAVEKELREYNRFDEFLEDINNSKRYIIRFCNESDHELLYIDGTTENEVIEPGYIFLTTPSTGRSTGEIGYTLGGIVSTLKELEKS